MSIVCQQSSMSEKVFNMEKISVIFIWAAREVRHGNPSKRLLIVTELTNRTISQLVIWFKYFKCIYIYIFKSIQYVTTYKWPLLNVFFEVKDRKRERIYKMWPKYIIYVDNKTYHRYSTKYLDPYMFSAQIIFQFPFEFQ